MTQNWSRNKATIALFRRTQQNILPEMGEKKKDPSLEGLSDMLNSMYRALIQLKMTSKEQIFVSMDHLSDYVLLSEDCAVFVLNFYVKGPHFWVDNLRGERMFYFLALMA